MKGPFYEPRLKARLRMALRKEGYGFREINDVVSGFDSETMQLATAMTAARLNVSAPEEPVGGQFLDWIEQFLDSEFGRTLIDILMKLLLGLL